MNNHCINNDEIEVKGLCNLDLIDFDLDLYPYWKQLSIPEDLLVPAEKPNIEEINSVNINVQIIRKKVIVTPTSGGVGADPLANNNEKKLTGRKLIIEGLLCQTVTYIADVPQQSLHSIQCAVPFSAFIVVPLKIGTAKIDSKDVNFEINSCIEDVFIKAFSPRQLFENVTLLLQAVPIISDKNSDECL